MLTVAVLSLSLFAGAFAQQQILRCRYEDSSFIHQLQEAPAYVDVQGIPSAGLVDVRVQRPSDMDYINKYLSDCEVVVEDLEKLTLEVQAQNDAARNAPDPVWFSAYHTYTELFNWYRDQNTRYPTLTRFGTIGRSAGGNDLFYLSIYNYGTSSGAPTTPPLYKAFNTAGIHAREWIAPATLNYLAASFLDSYLNNASDTLVQQQVRQVETFFLGTINPDGYIYSWTTASNARQWRKNRRSNSGSTCIGADENRNFVDHWGQGGSSSDPCSDTYMGPSAGSELEVQAVSNFYRAQQTGGVSGVARSFIYAIDWHSYSQLILRPYGWTQTLCPDENRTKALGDQWAADIRTQSGLTYTSQRSIQLYVTTGSASDWYYGNATASNGQRAAGFTIELRPTGSNPGFVLPPNQIIPTGAENWAGLRNFMESLRARPLWG